MKMEPFQAVKEVLIRANPYIYANSGSTCDCRLLATRAPLLFIVTLDLKCSVKEISLLLECHSIPHIQGAGQGTVEAVAVVASEGWHLAH